MKRLLLGAALLPLLGCPKTVSVTCTWSSDGNPSIPACGTAPCLQGYSLYNQNTGTLIATIPITSTSYSFSASTSTMSGPVTLGLQVNLLNADGTVTASPRALSSVTIQ